MNDLGRMGKHRLWRNLGATIAIAGLVAGVASAFPERRLERDVVVAGLKTLFPEEEASFIENVVERSGVENRYIVPTVEEVLAGSTFTERNRRYRGAALELARRACTEALDRADLAPEEIDVLVDVAGKMEAKTICAFADAAAWPIQGLLRHFRDDFVQHVTQRKCPFAGSFEL